jgi:CubicO group peptidase (beta-lactamase class C family)
MHCVRQVRFAVALVAMLIAACSTGDNVGSTPPPFIPPAQPAAGTLGDGRLGEIVEWARATQNVPAMGAIVIQRGQVIERGVSGLRSVDRNVRVALDDKWHIGAITKSMTATLAMLMVEDGLITLDTTPLDVWPELDATINPGFRAITLRDLLANTSGMKHDDAWAGAADTAPGTLVEKRRAWAARLLAEPPDSPRGNWWYSNVGYMVAGAMLETRAQAQWETLLESRLFTPLGMTHSGFGAPGAAGQFDQPLGHNTFPTSFTAIEPGPGSDSVQALGPSSTVHGSLDDLARYLQAHLAGEEGVAGILSVASFQSLHTVVAQPQGYALGWQRIEQLSDFGFPAWGHNGTNNRWFAVMWFSPDKDVGVLVVTNCGGDRGQQSISTLDLKLRARILASP